MPLGTYQVGKVVGCTIDGTAAEMASGSVTEQVGVVDTTNATSGGFREIEPGIKSMTGNATVVYGTPPAATAGDEVTLAITVGATPRYGEVVAMITSVVDSWSVAGEYTLVFNWESTGEYTIGATTP